MVAQEAFVALNHGKRYLNMPRAQFLVYDAKSDLVFPLSVDNEIITVFEKDRVPDTWMQKP